MRKKTKKEMRQVNEYTFTANKSDARTQNKKQIALGLKKRRSKKQDDTKNT